MSISKNGGQGDKDGAGQTSRARKKRALDQAGKIREAGSLIKR